MKRDIVIALDCMGGDRAPGVIIEGAALFAKSNYSSSFRLYGDSEKISTILSHHHELKERSVVIHSNDPVSAEDKPSSALRKKSSMKDSIESVKNGESDVAISAGNTGALMALSKIILRPLPNIDRPAIVTSVPNKKKKATVLLDMGANLVCSPEVLYQFAVMGRIFAKIVLNIDSPSVGILNIGSEDMKGHDEIKAAANLIKESAIKDSFIGYVEGDDITKGTVDVVVTDGFSGNVALKTMEGVAKTMSSFIKDGFSNSIASKIGYLFFCKNSFSKVFKTFDPRLHNGAMLIGLNGVVVKSHGSTDKIGFCNAISVATSLVKNRVNERIALELNSDKRA